MLQAYDFAVGDIFILINIMNGHRRWNTNHSPLNNVVMFIHRN